MKETHTINFNDLDRARSPLTTGADAVVLGASWMRKVKKPVEDRKLESKIAGWGQLC